MNYNFEVPNRGFVFIVCVISMLQIEPLRDPGVVPHLEATLPYSKFNGFNKLPALVRLGRLDLELPSTLLLYFSMQFSSLPSIANDQMFYNVESN